MYCNITEVDRQPIAVEGSTIDHVNQFKYLGAVISDNGQIDVEIDQCIANASKTFGALRQAIFQDHNLSTNTKMSIYQACVLSVLLYGAECWTPLRRHLK